MGIRDHPVAPSSPWQNGHVERLIGSIRRECRDHVVVLVLLRHKRSRFSAGLFRAQQGHRNKALASATVSLWRTVAMEFGMWRWGRSGGASGSVTGGNLSFLEAPVGTRS